MATIAYTLASNNSSRSYATVSLDGRYVAYESPDGCTVVDLQSGVTKTATFDPFFQAALPSLSRDGQLLAYVTFNASVYTFHVMNTATGVVHDVYTLQTSAIVQDAEISSDGKFLYFITDDGTSHNQLQRIDVQSGAVNVLTTTDGSDARISDDGRYAVISEGGAAYRYDLQTQAKVLIATGVPVDSFSISLSGDGHFAVFGNVLHNMDTGVNTPIAGGAIERAVISADGSHIAFVTADPAVSSGAGANHHHVVIKDIASGAFALVADVGSEVPPPVLTISADGLEVGFTTAAQLASNDTDTGPDAYVARLVPPTITIDAISGDGLISSLESQLPVKVTGTSNAIGQTVHITSPNGSTATAIVAADGTWQAQFVDVTGTAEGVHNFTADVVDASTLHGIATKSADFDYTPPALVLNAVAGDNIVARREQSAIVIDGSSDAIGQQVSLSIDGTFIGKAPVDADGKWSFTYNGTNLSDGQHEVEFSVADAAGNVKDRSIFFDKVAPHNAAPTFFVGGGYVVTPVGPLGGGEGHSLVIRPDGHLVVAGWAINDIVGNDLLNFAEVSYLPDGHLDTTFGNGGYVIDGKGTALSVALQADNKTVVAGRIGTGFGLERFNADGTLDGSFGNGGIVKTQISNGFDTAMAVVVDGTKIIAVGNLNPLSNSNDFALVRYLADGSLDPTFGSGGIVTTDFGSPSGFFEGAVTVKVQADGKIVIGGQSSTFTESFLALARYNTDGTLDSSFGTGGKVTTSILVSSSLEDIQLQSDGKILAVGATYDGSESMLALVRYTSSGALDTSFGGTGKVITNVVAGPEDAKSVVVQPDGKILVGGWSLISPLDANVSHQFTIVRYNANGSVDTTFGDAGVVLTQVGGFEPTSEGTSIKLQADGKIVLAGWSIDHDDNDGSHAGFAVARYNPDGSLDPTFGGTNSLGNTVSFAEGGDPVVLDATAKIFDSDLAGLDNGEGNYGGASVTLARSGGANADDVFGASGSLAFTGTNVVLAGVTVGSFTQSGGQLVIIFAAGATQAQVNGVLDAITYANSHDFPTGTTTQVQIAWTFSDGNSGLQGIGGAASTAGITTVDITADNTIGMALAIDSGTPDDGVTNVGMVNLTGLTLGGTWSYSTDAGAHFTAGTGTSFTLSGDGPKDVLVQEIGPNNEIRTATFSFTLDTSAAKPALALANDTGTPGDGVTKVGTVNVSGLETGATYEYSVNGGAFVAGSGASFTLTGDGLKNVLVHQIDAAGNASANATLSFTLDTSAAAPTVALANDTGTPGDGVTRVGTVNVSGIETGATWEYAVNGGAFVAGSGASFTLTGDGLKNVLVHQIDAAGNTSANATLSFTLDTSAAAPAVALATDSGIAGDRVTRVGTVNVSGLEAGATWEYSVNGGAFVAGTGSSFTLTGDGAKTALVHQIDAAGNTSGNTSLAFTLDTVTSDVITTTGGAVTNAAQTVQGTGEAGAQIQLLDGGTPLGAAVTVNSAGQWSAAVTLVGNGSHVITAAATDIAGNTATSNAITFTLGNGGVISQPDQVRVSGTGGSDHILVQPGNLLVSAGAGDDTLSLTAPGQFGVHLIDGGAGTDTLDLSAMTTAILVDLSTGLATGSQIGLSLLASVENVTGGSGNDTIVGSGSANLLDGGAGRDIIRGGNGNDTIIGGAGNDALTGGGGNDTFVFRPGFGRDVITDFQVGGASASSPHDVLDLRGLGFTSIQDVLNHTDLGPNAVIHAGVDDITLQGVTRAQLAAHQFDFTV